jgi:hypothetical protein
MGRASDCCDRMNSPGANFLNVSRLLKRPIFSSFLAITSRAQSRISDPSLDHVNASVGHAENGSTTVDFLAEETQRDLFVSSLTPIAEIVRRKLAMSAKIKIALSGSQRIRQKRQCA